MENASSSSVGLTKVVLYKHGIGYFERRGIVTGPSKINLLCEADEIDDMLKSLLALCTDGSRVDAVTYDSSKTLESRLGEFGFDITTCSGLAELLGQMRGIPVTISVSGEALHGRVLGIDTTEIIVNDQIVREQQLTIYMENNSFKSVPLSSISAIKVDDAAMAAELSQQLELLFQNVKKKDRKSLSVSLSEPGEHDLLIAYSIPCPIWKTSYRLVMDAEQRVLLQGMAIVDNVQEEDWTGVQIVLVSASPISFIQPLYDPVQPERPRIAAQGNVSSGPIVAERAKREQIKAKLMAPSARQRSDSMSEEAAPMAMAMEVSADSFLGNDTAYGSAGGWGQSFAENMAAPIAVEGGEKGELFEYRIEKPVTIPRNSSALIPIVQQVIEGERISLYNESKNTKFPYAAIRFVNNTGLTLEGGPVTVMEGDLYAGEALLDTVKPDDLRFLLYAVDEACPVVVRQTTSNKPFWRARTFHSILYIDYRQMREKTYEIENLSERKKVIFVEHPVTPGWNLAADAKPDESTQNYYRFKVEIDSKESVKLNVAEETDAVEQVYLSNYRGVVPQRLEWLCAQNFVDGEFIKFLKRILEMRQEIQSIEEKIANETALLTQYTNDQSRARENLKSLGANNERYRKVIDNTEDQIGEANKKLQALSRELQEYTKKYYEFCAQKLVTDIESTKK